VLTGSEYCHSVIFTSVVLGGGELRLKPTC
jgi:hypothetical protein